MKLTKMEKMVLNALRNNCYNDCYQEDGTWAFVVTDYSGLDPKQARGAFSSVIKKGLAGFQEDKEEDMAWLTDEGKALFDNADGEECSWGGPRLLKIEDEVETKKEIEEEKKMTVKEMRAEAKEMGIKGYSRMSKEGLQKAIEANTVEEKAEEVEEKAVKTVVMKAFTGMWIGEFEVIKETNKTITVVTKKGELEFDKATGIQLDANNPKFANHIELA